MTSIDRHISELLRENECLVVPKLGGFVITGDTNTTGIVARKEVDFNEAMDYNDGILAERIAEREKISYDEAILKIGRFVDHCNASLQRGNSVTIDQVGVLSKDSGKRLLFKSFGNFKIEETPIRISDSPLLAEAAHEIEVLIEEDEPEAEIIQQEASIPQEIRWQFDGKFLLITIALLVGGLLLLQTYRLNRHEGRPAEAGQPGLQSVKITAPSESTVPGLPVVKGVVNTEVLKKSGSQVISPTSTASVVQQKTPTIPSSSRGYYIVMGSFSSGAAADNRIATLRSSGFDHAFKLLSSSGRTLVCVNRFSSMKEAQDFSEQMRRTDKEVWIYLK